MPQPFRLHFEDLIGAALAGRLRGVIGRSDELRRVARTVSRRTRNNTLLVGPPGVGKSALVDGFAVACARPATAADAGPFPNLPIIRLDTTECVRLLSKSPTRGTVHRVHRALASLPPCVVAIDELGALVRAPEGKDLPGLEELFAPFFARSDLRLLGTLTEEEERAFIRGKSRVEKYVEVLHIASPPVHVCADILAHLASSLSAQYGITVPPATAAVAAELAQHLPPSRALPDRAIQLADEACASCALHGRSLLTEEDLHDVAAERSGMPRGPSLRAGRARLQSLTETLGASIHGQDHVVRIVSDLVRRGWLGVRNPSRPLGAFLFLGPSGVGKTETARVLSRQVYGTEQAFVRIDLSEFHDRHTVQRLIGAPPGYIGHEAGGQLTNPIAAQPFSLVLLDEIEKAAPAVLDVFLHVLDDGRLTDGRGQTVDFTKTIIIATSNLGAERIHDAVAQGVDATAPDFLRRELLPLLLSRLRPEFVNRFDAVLAFRPLTVEDLVEISFRELRNIEARLARHRIRFRVSPGVIREKAAELYDPRFGARPLKRYVEALCEEVIARRLLTHEPP